MLETICWLALVLPGRPGPSDPEPWPTGTLSRAPFAGRQGEIIPDDEGEEAGPKILREGDDRPWELFVQDFHPGTASLIAPVAPLPSVPPASQDFLPPHDSFEGFFQRHGSSDAWRDAVWYGYLSQPAILLPIGLAVSAAVVYHWDQTLAEHWQGVLGGHQTLSNIGTYGLIGASLVIGIFLPGEGRNGWDEFWTQAEAYAASTMTTTVLKYGVARIRPDHGPYSFPSGHTTYAFTGATLIDRNSGAPLGIPAYALAAFTGFERVESGRHYPSDVLAGAAIGSFSAGIFDALHWGTGPGGGGIARRSVTCRVEMDGLRGGLLEVAFDF